MNRKIKWIKWISRKVFETITIQFLTILFRVMTLTPCIWRPFQSEETFIQFFIFSYQASILLFFLTVFKNMILHKRPRFYYYNRAQGLQQPQFFSIYFDLYLLVIFNDRIIINNPLYNSFISKLQLFLDI